MVRNRKVTKKLFIALSFLLVLALANSFSSDPELALDELRLSKVFLSSSLEAQSSGRIPTDRWAAVRFLANESRQLNRRIEDLLDSIDFNRLKGSGSFSRDVICGSTTCTARLRFNQTSETLSPTIGSSATYKNSFEIFVKSSGTRVLALHFDDPTNLSSGAGVLFSYKPSQWQPLVFGTDAIVESRFTLESGLRTQVISMSGGPLFLQGAFDSWRVRLQESLDGTTVGAFGRGRINRTRNTGSQGFGTACSNPQAFEYTVTFLFNASSPNNSTAKMNIRQVSGTSTSSTAQDCTALRTFVTSENYGLFNSTSGFVQDSVAAANIPTEYPKASLVDALETLLSSNENYSIGTISGLDVKVVGNAR